MQARKVIQKSANYDSVFLVDEYGDAVYKFCRSLTYSKEDAEDLFQETFLQVIKKPNKLYAFDNPQSYLFSTALFIWKSWKRKYARRNRLAPVEPLNETVESKDSVEDSYMIQEENRIVQELVDGLPDKFKIPTILFYAMEMNVSDIAVTLQIPVGTVKSRLFKARKLVEKGLGDIQYGK